MIFWLARRMAVWLTIPGVPLGAASPIEYTWPTSWFGTWRYCHKLIEAIDL